MPTEGSGQCRAAKRRPTDRQRFNEGAICATAVLPGPPNRQIAVIEQGVNFAAWTNGG
jgi:hypothetical protein